MVKKRQEERRQRTGERICLRAAGHTENAPVEYRPERTADAGNRIILYLCQREAASDENGGYRCLCSALRDGIGIDAAGKHRRSHGETARAGHEQPDGRNCRMRWRNKSQISSTLVAEDKLEMPCDRENAAAGNTTGTAAETVMPEGTENTSMDGTGNSAVDPTEENTGSVVDGTSADSNVTKKYDRCDRQQNRTRHRKQHRM